jgi:hypothetical protein
MWISNSEYRELIERAAASDARVESLTHQLNVALHDVAQLKFEKTGIEQKIPVFAFQREASKPRATDLETGVSFDDMGDIAAHAAGFTEE